MIVSLAGCKDALVVMGEPDQVDPVVLVVICVDFPIGNEQSIKMNSKFHLLSSLQVIESHRKVLAARNQILAIVRDVN